MSLMLVDTRKRGDAGYFRIGHVVLDIPPTDITTRKVTADEEVLPLRGKYAMHRKTGHNRWDVTVRWRALATWKDGVYDYSQWQALRTILAIFKAAPFVQVENDHVRQILMSDPDAPDGTSRDARMAFALRMLRVDTIPDIPMGLEATLTMSWFNYRPYSIDFGYLDGEGASVEAYNSEYFAEYIRTWMAENLDEPPNPFPDRPDLAEKYGYPDMLPWDRQTPGSMTFYWRTYKMIPRQQGGLTPAKPTDGGAAPAPSSPAPTPQRTGGYQDDLVTAIAMEIRRFEGWIAGREVNGARVGGSRAWRNHNPGNIEARKGEPSDGRFRIYGSDAEGWQALKDLIVRYFRTLADKSFYDFFKKYAPPHENNTQQYAATVVSRINKSLGTGFTVSTQLAAMWNAGNPLPRPAAQTSQFASALRELSGGSVQAASKPAPLQQAAGVDPEVIEISKADIADGWALDHYTERAVFLYKEFELPLADEEHGDGPNEHGLWPVQTSVVFVNSLAALPLRSYQYPTMQHIGPAGTMVVVGFTSEGFQEADEEPVHPGLNRLSGMCSSLESQFHRLRGEWRSISSTHRMQSAVVENQVLNMLGIRGATVRGLDEETVPESPATSQVSLTLSQYENIFEEIEPFRVKGTGKQYRAILDEYMASGKLEALTGGRPDSVFAPLVRYRDARNKRDPGPVLAMLEDREYAAPPVPMPVVLSDAQMEVLRAAAASSSGPDSKVLAATPGAVPVGFGSGATWEQAHPELAARLKAGSLNFNEYYRLTHDPTLSKIPDVTKLSAEVDQAIRAKGADPVASLYNQVLDYQAFAASYGMSRAVQELELVPEVRTRLKDAANQDGPAREDVNKDHGAYRDLGLKTIELAGRDFNPGYYFKDYGREKRADLQAKAAEAAAIAVQAANTFNAKKTTAGGKVDHLSGIDAQGSMAGSGGTSTGASGTALFDPQATASAILAQTVIPYHSMARAFPCFKLFLCEEDNSGPFLAFDDFYSYASVLSIEIRKSQNEPDLAVVNLTNFANLLSHRLFDGTTAGKRERSLSNLQEIPASSNDDAMTGEFAGKASGEENWLGVQRRKVLDLTQGFDKKTEVPLQYYPLQTGAKVQIRMGFSNNPDKLWPVFTGKVTQLEGEDVVQMVCQGYLLELMDPAPEDLQYDGYNLGTLSQLVQAPGAIVKSWTEGKFKGSVDQALGPGPAYGGWSIMRDSGHTESVMEAVLKTSGAKHFGHWQVDPRRGANQFLKGFGWVELAGKAADSLGMSQVGALLASGYDRRGENILINRFINIDGSTKDIRLTRSFMYERPLNLFPAAYHVPKDPAITPWRILQDVARRYPDYILTVRPYGFPVGCDATLVFANPNDVYVTRRALAGEAEAGRLDESEDARFSRWWSAIGWKRFQAWLNNSAVGSSLAKEILARLRGSVVLTVMPWSSTAVVDLTKMIDQGHVRAFNEVMQAAVSIAGEQEFANRASHLINITAADGVAAARRLRQEANALYRSLLNYLQVEQARQDGLATDPRPIERVQPVRRWHLIPAEAIIHNGIRLNEAIYNAVRVDRKIQKANAAIPDFHTRVLDCDRLIIDPVKNVRTPGLEKAYSQSFLRQELGKMYRGELVLAGQPEIEPYDVLLVYDPSTGMAGPVEVESVNHSFDQENGFITVVAPRALVIVNEAMTAGLLAALNGFFGNLGAELSGAWQDIKEDPKQGVAGLAGAAVGYAKTRAGIWVAGAALGALGIASAPIAITAGAALVAMKLLWMADDRQSANPVFVAPMNRYGRPWVGGLNGWQLTDLHTLWNRQFHEMWDFEIAPTIEGFKRLAQVAGSEL